MRPGSPDSTTEENEMSGDAQHLDAELERAERDCGCGAKEEKRGTASGIQMCTVGDLPSQGECFRAAQWFWRPDDTDHPVFLCNFHAEPLLGADLRSLNRTEAT